MHTGRAKLSPFDPEAKQPKMSYKVRIKDFTRLACWRHAKTLPYTAIRCLERPALCHGSCCSTFPEVLTAICRMATRSSILC